MVYLHLLFFLQYVKNKFCTSQKPIGEIWVYETSNTAYTIDNLKPFSMYTLRMHAVNTLHGEVATTEIETEEIRKEIEKYKCNKNINIILAEIQEYEYPRNLKLFNVTCDAVILTHDEIECEKVNGPLLIFTTTKCISDWCKTDIVKNLTMISSYFKIDSLIPYSNYSTTVSVARNNTKTDAAAIIFTIDFQTLRKRKY